MEIEDCRLATTTFVMVAGNSQILMLKLVDRCTLRDRIFAGAPFNWVIKANITNDKTSWHPAPPDTMHQEG